MRAGGALIRLGTKFASIDDLVARFAPFVTETTLLMPAVADVAEGTEGRFVVQLADKSEALSGRCRVEEIKPSAGGTKPLMRLRLLGMDEASRKVHQRLLAARRVPPAPPPVALKPPPLPRPAPTLIGQPPMLDPAQAAPLPIAETTIEATERNRWLSNEARAEGAAFTLPANPLSDLGAGDLASFIECTLFEAEAEAAPAAADAPTPFAEAAPLPVLGAGPETVSRRWRAPLRRGLLQAAPYALCTIVGVLVGSALRGGPAAAPTPVVVAAPAPPPARPAVPAAPAAPKPAAVAAAPPAAPAENCAATVTTEPDGAAITWGTRNLGRTPIRSVPVACGAATVTLRHERYRDVERDVTAEPGRAAVVSERLRRPSATLALSSTPAHATFTLNQQSLGAGPRNVNVMRFEHLRLEARLPGYQPWTQTIYVKEPTTKIVAQLVPVPKAPARGAARPPAKTFSR